MPSVTGKSSKEINIDLLKELKAYNHQIHSIQYAVWSSSGFLNEPRGLYKHSEEWNIGNINQKSSSYCFLPNPQGQDFCLQFSKYIHGLSTVITNNCKISFRRWKKVVKLLTSTKQSQGERLLKKTRMMLCDCCRHSTSWLAFNRGLLKKLPALNNSQNCGVPLWEKAYCL